MDALAAYDPSSRFLPTGGFFKPPASTAAGAAPAASYGTVAEREEAGKAPEPSRPSDGSASVSSASSSAERMRPSSRPTPVKTVSLRRSPW